MGFGMVWGCLGVVGEGSDAQIGNVCNGATQSSCFDFDEFAHVCNPVLRPAARKLWYTMTSSRLWTLDANASAVLLGLTLNFMLCVAAWLLRPMSPAGAWGETLLDQGRAEQVRHGRRQPFHARNGHHTVQRR